MVQLMRRRVSDEVGIDRPNGPPAKHRGGDWRGWIALGWVLIWGFAYAVMAIEARAGQFTRWIEALAGWARSS
jgi:hypothetical protein